MPGSTLLCPVGFGSQPHSGLSACPKVCPSSTVRSDKENSEIYSGIHTMEFFVRLQLGGLYLSPLDVQMRLVKPLQSFD